MDLIIVAVAVAAVLALLGLVAQWGVDSRPSFIDPRTVETGSTSR
jgi:hypothetical protein